MSDQEDDPRWFSYTIGNTEHRVNAFVLGLFESAGVVVGHRLVLAEFVMERTKRCHRLSSFLVVIPRPGQVIAATPE
jgi:hypothetical protein